MEQRKLIDSKRGQGLSFEVHEYQALTGSSILGAESLYYARQAGVTLKQLAIRLEGGKALLQPGALQYMHGGVEMKVTGGGGGVGGFLSRAITSAATGESGYKPEYAGRGVVWCEPTFKHLLIAELPGEDLLIDDGVFAACESTIKVGRHVNKNVGAAVLGGEGLIQSKLSGSGLFVLESPVPMSEVDVLRLSNDTLTVDGDLVMAYSASLDFRIEKSTKGLLSSARSGEGLVHVFRGSGQVWVTPTLGLHRRFEPVITTTTK